MDLTLVTGIFPPDIGGPASYVPAIATALSRRGHRVRVVTLSDRLGHDDSGYGFTVRRIPRGLRKPYRNLVTVWVIYRALRGADLLYVSGLAFECMLAALGARVPMVHKVVGDYAWERARSRGWFRSTLDAYQHARKGPRLKLLDWVRTAPLRRACLVIVPSAYLQRIVTGWGIPADRVRVIYNAVEEPRVGRVDLAPFPGRTVTTACRIVAWKGVDALIRILPRLDGVRLAVIGDGMQRPTLQQLAEELGVASRVLFMGNLPRDAVAGVLKRSDVFVLNSSYEGLPHVVLEAMAAGVPVVATDVGGTGEVVESGRTGLLVPVGDQDALERALRTLLEHPTLGGELASDARRRLASEFAFDTMVLKTEEVLDAGRPPRGNEAC